jgi:hypothetical protein
MINRYTNAGITGAKRTDRSFYSGGVRGTHRHISFEGIKEGITDSEY